MQTVITINAVIMALFFVCYSYQFFYVAVALLKRKKFTCRNENHRIAVLIAARNEENVIGQLIDSIHAQKNYPMDHVDIYVGADNCTDDTARVARERGAIVFERHDTVHVGKGYVLNEMLKRIKRTGRKHYDAYLVLDADNILDPNFISEIEKVYSGGYEIVTCYATPKTTATTGSPRAMRCGSCARRSISITRACALEAAAPCPAQAFCFPTVCWKRAAAGTSSC